MIFLKYHNCPVKSPMALGYLTHLLKTVALVCADL